jgi:LysM repeat protein
MANVADRYYVTFRTSTLEVRVLLDAPSPAISGGFGGWEVIDRPKRSGLTRFKGKDPFQQNVAILFDGVEDDEDQEPMIADLMAMTEPRTALETPPQVTVDGTVLRTDIQWVIQNITFSTDNVIWTMLGGSPRRLRQPAMVELLEFIDDKVILTRPTPAIASKSKPAKNIKVPDEATLYSLAIQYYGDPNQYMQIWYLNPTLDPDPRAPIPKGINVTIPTGQRIQGGKETGGSKATGPPGAIFGGLRPPPPT